jgi:hypothetical protein
MYFASYIGLLRVVKKNCLKIDAGPKRLPFYQLPLDRLIPYPTVNPRYNDRNTVLELIRRTKIVNSSKAHLD